LTNDWILETHVHADHLTAAQYLRDKIGGKVAIGRRVMAVQRTFGELFNAGPEFRTDGSQFDKLFDDHESFEVGGLHARVIATPGHTPDSVTYVVGDRAFVGDTLFMPDYGTARTDFPGGDAGTLYQSIEKILALPDDTRLYMCHDYKAPGRDEFRWETTVAEQRRQNIHLTRHDDLLSFVHFRQDRDTELATPRLMLPAVQINMRAGHLPPAESNGKHYLKLPVSTP
jgi:glyoxylase-like metal-dependent hydrolase (beta-lactamase superfamily II)